MKKIEKTSRPGAAARAKEPGAAALSLALDAMGDPWSYLVHQESFFGVRRFAAFQENLAIAKNTLADRLRRLVRHGLLAKVVYEKRPLRHEYRLTRRGLDTYPYALALMRWGDDWLSDGAPPVTLRHLACGKILHAIPVCAACRREIQAEDVAIRIESAYAPARPHGVSMRTSSRPALYTAGRQTSVSRTLAVIGDRWGFFILWLAFAGVAKFEHFHRILGVARTILTARLERFVRQGIMERRLYTTRPPRHDYQLTGKGRALCPVLLTLAEWAERSFASPGEHARVLHKSCGAPLHTEMVCAHCKHAPEPRDVQVVDAPLLAAAGRRPADARKTRTPPALGRRRPG